MPPKIKLSISHIALDQGRQGQNPVLMRHQTSLPHVVKRYTPRPRTPQQKSQNSVDLSLRVAFASVFQPSKEISDVMIMQPAVSKANILLDWGKNEAPSYEPPAIDGHLMLAVSASTKIRAPIIKNVIDSGLRNELKRFLSVCDRNDFISKLVANFVKINKNQEKLEIIRAKNVSFWFEQYSPRKIIQDCNDTYAQLQQRFVHERQEIVMLLGSENMLRYLAYLKYQLTGQKYYTVHIKETSFIDEVASTVRFALLRAKMCE